MRDCLNLAYRDPDYAEILRRCDCVWPDGTGVRIAGRRLGFPVPENVNGTDLFPLLSGRVFLYGAAPGVAERAAENVRRRYPQMTIVGTADGFGDERLVRFTISAWLKASHFEVTAVERPEEALRELKAHAYDVVLSDVMMGMVDGFMFRDTVRGFNEKIPIIFLAALVNSPSNHLLEKVAADLDSYYAPKNNLRDVTYVAGTVLFVDLRERRVRYLNAGGIEPLCFRRWTDRRSS